MMARQRKQAILAEKQKVTHLENEVAELKALVQHLMKESK
jgi:hypothetical protein